MARAEPPPGREPRWLRWAMPLATALLALAGWEAVVRIYQLPQYLLPGPLLVAKTLWANLGSLLPSWWFTLKITVGALALAVLGGVALGALFAVSRWVELSLFPFAVVLQVTPIVAIAPLILIFVDSTTAALLLCAWIVAFFPILSNTIMGLNSADHNLVSLFQLYGANRWQTLRYLRLPAALPYFLSGLKISGGLALIGAVVAEFVAGTGGSASGLAYRILESGYQLKIPRMFAALLMISMTGIAIFLATSYLAHRLLHRWHESAIKRES